MVSAASAAVSLEAFSSAVVDSSNSFRAIAAAAFASRSSRARFSSSSRPATRATASSRSRVVCATAAAASRAPSAWSSASFCACVHSSLTLFSSAACSALSSSIMAVYLSLTSFRAAFRPASTRAASSALLCSDFASASLTSFSRPSEASSNLPRSSASIFRASKLLTTSSCLVCHETSVFSAPLSSALSLLTSASMSASSSFRMLLSLVAPSARAAAASPAALASASSFESPRACSAADESRSWACCSSSMIWASRAATRSR
mmetsp:Transcript_11463/g.48054  ORF Transcript_11463/g.48054 Transcript_11463/m.48054 type:complete len:263 (+) Transcript_11463:1636-2424(+)